MTSEPSTLPRAQQAVLAVGAGLLGVVVGIGGAVVHRHAFRPGGVLLPWGLLLALATAFAVTVAAGRLARGPGAFGVAIGWAVVLLWLQQVRPEGDYVYAGDFLGNAYVFGGMVSLAVAVVRGMTAPPLSERPPT
jgi:Family of unknown function (DUF6113)